MTVAPDELPAGLLRDLRGRPADDPVAEDEQGSRITRAPRVGGDRWLERLPHVVDEALERWDLRRDVEHPLRAGRTALVVPVHRPRGDAGALKVQWPHAETDTEHLALRAWRAEGSVRLLSADPASGTLLLERLDADRDLTGGSVLDTTEVLGGLVRALDRPAPPWAPRLSTHLGHVGADLAAAQADPVRARALPRRMAQQAAALTRDLLSEGHEALDRRLVHSDLHQRNVLWRPDPGGWVAIDPTPMAADPHWALAPALWNRWDAVRSAHDARSHLQLRLGILCEAADLDQDRARRMTIVRLVHTALRAATHTPHEAQAWADKAVTVVKAMQPG